MSAVSESPGADRTLEDLLERVKGLSGPDRETDAELAIALGLPPEGAFRIRGFTDEAAFGTGPYSYWQCPTLTASLDAVVALCERVLPGWTFILDTRHCPRARMFPPGVVAMPDPITEHGATLPLALLAALLEALVKSRSPSLVG